LGDLDLFRMWMIGKDLSNMTERMQDPFFNLSDPHVDVWVIDDEYDFHFTNEPVLERYKQWIREQKLKRIINKNE